MSRKCALIAFLCAMLLPGAAAAADKVAVFDFELIDTSLDGQMLGPNAAEQLRLAGMAPRLREWFGRQAKYDVADMASVEDRAKAANLEACGGCVARLAHEVGAGIAITGTVQKVSNLILNVNLYVTDVESKKAVAAMSTDIRSNSDESWHRGLAWLIAHRLPAALEKVAR